MPSTSSSSSSESSSSTVAFTSSSSSSFAYDTASRKVIELYVGVDEARLVDLLGASEAVDAMEHSPVRGDQVLFCFRCYQAVGGVAVYAIPADARLEFVVGNQYGAGSANHMVYAGNDDFVDGDWSLAYRSGGRVCCRADFNSALLAADLGSATEKTYVAELVMTPSGETYQLTLLQCDILVRNDLYRVGEAGTISIVIPHESSSSSSDVSTSSTSESSAATSTSLSSSSESSTSESS